jgi:hypothetical protein
VIPAPARRSHPALWAAPSEEVIDSAEDVVCLENEVKSLGLRRQKEESLDWFRQREDREQERAAQLEEEERNRQARLAAEQRRQNWNKEWLAYGLRQIPYDAPDAVRLDVHEALEQVLARVDPSHPQTTTRQLVEAAIDRALTPWRTATQREDAIKDVCEGANVPWEMRQDSTWKGRLYEAARTAVDRLRTGAGMNEVKTAASQAIASLVREFEHGKDCAQLVADVWMKLKGETLDEREEGKDLARAALAKLPIGASRREMECARDNALEPIRRTIATRQDQAMREQLLRLVALPYRFHQLSSDVRQQALSEIAGAFKQLPIGTAKATLEGKIDEVIDRHYTVHQQHEREKKEAAQREADQQRKLRDAEYKASLYLRHIEKYVNEEYTFDGFFEMHREITRLQEELRKTLVEELVENPDMDGDQIRAKIEELVDRDLD